MRMILLIGLFASTSFISQAAVSKNLSALKKGRLAGVRQTVFLSPPLRVDNIYIRITGYTGWVTVDGWANGNNASPFWHKKTPQRPLTIPTTAAHDTIIDCLQDSHCADQSTQYLGNWAATDSGATIDSKYRKLVDGMLSVLQSSPDSDIGAETSLRPNLASGRNTVNVKIREHSANWSLSFELYTVDRNGVRHIFQQTYMDQTSTILGREVILNVN